MSTEPIDPNKAVDYLVEHSRRYAQAKADTADGFVQVEVARV